MLPSCHYLCPFLRMSEEEHSQTAFLPYVKENTDIIVNVLKKYGITTSFKILKHHKKISQLFRQIKDKILLYIEGLNNIRCSCDKIYIGQPGCLVSTNIQEHVRHTKNMYLKHCQWQSISSTTDCMVKLNEVSVLSSCTDIGTSAGSIEINKYKNTKNKKTVKLSQTWYSIL